MKTPSRKSLNVWSKMLLIAAISVIGMTLNFSSAGAEGLLDKIKKENKIVVATEAMIVPFEFVKDGKIVGYGKDILDVVVAGLGVELVQHNLPFQGIIIGLLAKKYDFVATSLAVTPERAKKVAFTMPIAGFDNLVIISANNTEIKSLDDLNNKIVGAQLNSSQQSLLEEFDLELKAKGGAGFKELKLYQSNPELNMALGSGQIDGSSLPSNMFAYMSKKRPGTIKSVGVIGSPTWICWATRPKDLDLRDYINSVILKLRDSGKLAEMQKKWLGRSQDVPDEGYLPEGAF